jgi:hypothetical protein
MRAVVNLSGEPIHAHEQFAIAVDVFFIKRPHCRCLHLMETVGSVGV